MQRLACVQFAIHVFGTMLYPSRYGCHDVGEACATTWMDRLLCAVDGPV